MFNNNLASCSPLPHVLSFMPAHAALFFWICSWCCSAYIFGALLANKCIIDVAVLFERLSPRDTSVITEERRYQHALICATYIFVH